MPTGALQKSRTQRTRVVDSRSALTKTMSGMDFAFVYSPNEFGWELNAAWDYAGDSCERGFDAAGLPEDCGFREGGRTHSPLISTATDR